MHFMYFTELFSQDIICSYIPCFFHLAWCDPLERIILNNKKGLISAKHIYNTEYPSLLALT